jgi:hypothetical protein
VVQVQVQVQVQAQAQAMMGTGFALTLSLSSPLNVIFHLCASYASTVFSSLFKELLNLYFNFL